MNRLLELRHLRNFLAVVEQKSISKAAGIVRLAQPALSRQLQTLEAELGAPLLVRHGWGVTPTPEGEILARHARSLLDQAQAVRDAVSTVSGSPMGKSAVGVPSSMAAILLPELVLAAREHLPRVQFRLVEGYSGNLHQRLLSGELDLAILYEERRRSTLVTRPLLREPLVAIGKKGQFSSKKSVSIQELATEKLILPASANRLRSLFEDALGEAGLAIGAETEMDSVTALLELVAIGTGVSILPYSTVHNSVTQGRLSYAPIAPEKLERSLMLARPAERLETPVWSATADLIYKILKSKENIYKWKVENPSSDSPEKTEG